MVFNWLLLLVMALCLVMTGIKDSIFYDKTDSSDCTVIPMTCGNDEECFKGQGMIPALALVMNKGCMLSTLCGCTEEFVTDQFISTCCYGEQCNRALTCAGSLKMDAARGQVLRVLRVLLLLQ